MTCIIHTNINEIASLPVKLGIGRNEHLESHWSHTWQLVGRSKTAFAPAARPCTAAAVVDVADRGMLVPLAVA